MKAEHGQLRGEASGHTLDWAFVQAAKTDGLPCGDGFLLQREGSRVLVALADGVGSGQKAHEAAGLCLRALEGRLADPLPRLFERCHDALVGSRGAALALGRIDLEEGQLEWGAVGDIDGCLYPADPADAHAKSLVQRGGTLGHYFTGVQPQSERWASGRLATLITDGVSRRARDLHPRDAAPRAFAARCMAEYGRANDDRTVVALVWRASAR